jgi:hypothetical protein
VAACRHQSVRWVGQHVPVWEDINRARNVDRAMLWFVRSCLSGAAFAMLLKQQLTSLLW